MSNRYFGKPFLRLVDSYVLDSIGHLDAATDAALTAMEPNFHRTFNTTGSWRAIVVAQMQFPEGMAGAIREMWDKGRIRFIEATGKEPDPVEFTQTFVDTKFPH